MPTYAGIKRLRRTYGTARRPLEYAWGPGRSMRPYTGGAYSGARYVAPRAAGWGALGAAGRVAGRAVPYLAAASAAWELGRGISDALVHHNNPKGLDIFDLTRERLLAKDPSGKLLAAFNAKVGAKGPGRGAKSHHQSVSTVTGVSSGVRAKRLRRTRHRRKKEPLRRRVGRLERETAEGRGTLRIVSLWNARCPQSLAGQLSSYTNGVITLHDPADRSTWFTGTGPVKFSGFTSGTAYNQTIPEPQYWEPDSVDPTKWGIVARSPYDLASSLLNKDMKFWQSFSSYVEVVLYNAHAYPVHVQSDVFSVKERAPVKTPADIAVEAKKATADTGDTEGAGAGTRWTVPGYNVLADPMVSKFYNRTTNSYEIPAGGVMTLRFKTTTRNTSVDKLNAENGEGITFPKASKILGTKYIYLRTWGALGTRDTGTTAGGAVEVPVNRLEMTAKVVNAMKYTAGGHKPIRIDRFVDQRDTDGNIEVLTADLEHNSSAKPI